MIMLRDSVIQDIIQFLEHCESKFHFCMSWVLRTEVLQLEPTLDWTWFYKNYNVIFLSFFVTDKVVFNWLS